MKVKSLKVGDKLICGITIICIESVNIEKKEIRAIDLLTSRHLILPESAIKHMEKMK